MLVNVLKEYDWTKPYYTGRLSRSEVHNVSAQVKNVNVNAIDHMRNAFEIYAACSMSSFGLR